MAGPDRIGQWVDLLNDAYAKEAGTLSVETAKNMLVLCACVESAITGFLIQHAISGVMESSTPILMKGKSDV